MLQKDMDEKNHHIIIVGRLAPMLVELGCVYIPSSGKVILMCRSILQRGERYEGRGEVSVAGKRRSKVSVKKVL